MDLAFIIGLVLAWGCTMISVKMEGGELSAFVSAGPAILVFGGTFGAVCIGLTLKEVKEIPLYFVKAMKGLNVDYPKIITQMVDFATRSRRDGILSLESEIENIDNEFMKKGFQLAVDGVDVDHMRMIMETDIATTKGWYKEGQEIWGKFGGFSPTLGIIGTVLGLVHMLGKLSDPGSMGPAIAAAFIATLYGVSFANLLFIPVSHKLKRLEGMDLLQKQIMMEGILSIQAGTSPRMIEQYLSAYLHEAKESELSKDKK